MLTSPRALAADTLALDGNMVQDSGQGSEPQGATTDLERSHPYGESRGVDGNSLISDGRNQSVEMKTNLL